MMQIYPYENVEKSKLFFRGVTESGVRDTVSEILRTVRDGGDAALRDYARRFDKAELTELEVPARRPGRSRWNPSTRNCADVIRSRPRKTSAPSTAHQVPHRLCNLPARGRRYPGPEDHPHRPGRPLYSRRHGRPIPPRVLMNAIPAKIGRLPPDRHGLTSHLRRRHRARSSWRRPEDRRGGPGVPHRRRPGRGRPGLWHGDQSPGWTRLSAPAMPLWPTAKRQVFGLVDIDMIAGPSEILVRGRRRGATPACVAADLLSQAEHDRMATAVLVTDSRGPGRGRVRPRWSASWAALPRQEIARASIDDNGKIILATRPGRRPSTSPTSIAPEHLELCVDEPVAILWPRSATPGPSSWAATARRRWATTMAGPQPHPAHQRHGPLLQPSERRRFCQENPVHLFHRRTRWPPVCGDDRHPRPRRRAGSPRPQLP